MLLNCGVELRFWTPESPLGCKEIQPVYPKGNQSWIFIGRTDVEAETPILWPPDAKNWLTAKTPDAGEDWRKENGMTENEKVGWHLWLNGHEFERAPGVDDGQGAWHAAVHRVTKSQTRLSNWSDWLILLSQKCLSLDNKLFDGSHKGACWYNP